MKKLLIGTAFVAMLATPALAQSFNPDYGTGNVNPAVNSLYGGQRYDSEGLTAHGSRSGGLGAYAYAPGRSARSRHWSSPGRQSYIQREDSDYPVYGEQ
jgi:N-methylhydantoinase B/oxoprolinase/acetone carboxylase alpha subunit